MAQGDARPMRKPHQPTIRPIYNEVRKARKEHTLKCGCLLRAGFQYIAVGVLIDGVFVNEKHHMNGCFEKLN